MSPAILETILPVITLTMSPVISIVVWQVLPPVITSVISLVLVLVISPYITSVIQGDFFNYYSMNCADVFLRANVSVT